MAEKPSIDIVGNPQPDNVTRLDNDLLAKWQSSPVGRAAASIHSLLNEIDELRRLESNAAAFAPMCAEGNDLEACHRQLGRLLLRISAAQARERLAEQTELTFGRRR